MGSKAAFALRPLSAVAPRTGIGQALDPTGVAARQFEGSTRAIIDPSGAIREGEENNKEAQRQIAAAQEAAKKRPTLTTEEEKKTLLGT